MFDTDILDIGIMDIDIQMFECMNDTKQTIRMLDSSM